MSTEHVGAESEALSTEREADLWRLADPGGSWVSRSWPAAVMFVVALALVALSEMPRNLFPVFAAILLLNVVVFALQYQRMNAIVKLLRVKK